MTDTKTNLTPTEALEAIEQDIASHLNFLRSPTRRDEADRARAMGVTECLEAVRRYRAHVQEPSGGVTDAEVEEAEETLCQAINEELKQRGLGRDAGDALYHATLTDDERAAVRAALRAVMERERAAADERVRWSEARAEAAEARTSMAEDAAEGWRAVAQDTRDLRIAILWENGAISESEAADLWGTDRVSARMHAQRVKLESARNLEVPVTSLDGGAREARAAYAYAEGWRAACEEVASRTENVANLWGHGPYGHAFAAAATLAREVRDEQAVPPTADIERALGEQINENHKLRRRLCVAEHGAHDLPYWSEVKPVHDPSGEVITVRACRRDCSYAEDGDGEQAEPSATPRPPEPGELIADVTCPCCGAKLRVRHGDDEGEIGVVGSAPTEPRPEHEVRAEALREAAAVAGREQAERRDMRHRATNKDAQRVHGVGGLVAREIREGIESLATPPDTSDTGKGTT